MLDKFFNAFSCVEKTKMFLEMGVKDAEVLFGYIDADDEGFHGV